MTRSCLLLPALLLVVACSAADSSQPISNTGAAPEAQSAATGRPLACTAEIVNTYYERPRFTGPGSSFDREATERVVAELLSGDCAVRPDDCVHAVVETATSVGASSRAAAVKTYKTSPACVAG